MAKKGTDKNKQGQKGTGKDRKGLSLLISEKIEINRNIVSTDRTETKQVQKGTTQ